MFLSSLNVAQKRALICLAHNVVVSDGELTAGERLYMDEMRREMELPAEYEARYLPLEGIEQIFDSRQSRLIALIALVRIGYADGAFEIEEQCLLSDLCRAFRIAGADYDLVRNWVRRLIVLEREVQSLM